MSKLLLVAILLVSFSSDALFEARQKRMVSRNVLMSLLQQKFPKGMSQLEMKFSCVKYDDSNRSITGGQNLATGELLTTGKSTAFVQWFTDCVSDAIELEYRELESLEHYSELLGAAALKRMADTGQEIGKLKEKKWSVVDKKLKYLFIVHQIEKLIGPNALIKDLNSALDIEILADQILNTSKSLKDLDFDKGLKETVLIVTLRDEFLVY